MNTTTAITWGAALIAGWVAEWAGVPAAWFIAPMMATMLVSVCGWRGTSLPPLLTIAAQAVLGGMISSSFTPTTMQILTQQWAPILMVVMGVVGLSVLGGLALARMSGLDITTALLGSLPGGAPAMVATSDALQADTRMVAVVQYLRVLLIVSTSSFLTFSTMATPQHPLPQALPVSRVLPSDGIIWWWAALATLLTLGIGAWAGIRAGLPAGAMVGAALLGAIVGGAGIPLVPLPTRTLALASLIVGVSVGMRFDAGAIRHIGRRAPAMLLTSLFLVTSSGILGTVFGRMTAIDPLTAYLAAVPGGINPILILAIEGGANTGLVLTIHLVRFLVIVAIGPLLVRWVAHALAPT